MKKLTAIVTLVTFLITGQAWGLSPELRTMQVQFRPDYNGQMAKVIRELTKKENISNQGLLDIFNKYDIDPMTALLKRLPECVPEGTVIEGSVGRVPDVEIPEEVKEQFRWGAKNGFDSIDPIGSDNPVLEIFAPNDPIWSDPCIEELRKDIEMNGMKNFTLSEEIGPRKTLPLKHKLYRHSNGLAVVEKLLRIHKVEKVKRVRKFFKERANEYCVPTFFHDTPNNGAVYELYLGDNRYKTVREVAGKLTEKDKELLREAIWKTFGRGWYHNQLHKCNILVKYDSGIQDIKFIDWKFLDTERYGKVCLAWLGITEDKLTPKYFKEQLDGKFRRIKLMYVCGEEPNGEPNIELLELPFKLEVTTARNAVMINIISKFENYQKGKQIGTIDFQIEDDKIYNLCVMVEDDYEPVKAWALEELKKLILYDLDIHNSYRVDSDPVSNSREGYNWKIALGDTLKMLRYLNESLKSAKEFKIPTTILFDTHWMKKTPHLDREKNRLISSLRKHCEKHGVEFVSWDMMKCRQISIGKGKRNLIVIADKECPQVKIEGDRENIRQYYFKIDGQAITNTPVKDGFEFYEPVFEMVTAALRETVVKQFVRRDTRYFTIEKGEDGTYTITLIPMEPVNCEELRKIYDMQIFV